MEELETIVAAGGVLTPIYLTLKQKGYTIRREKFDNLLWWIAENHQRRFIADDVMALLALVAMRETRGQEWQATDDQISEYMQLDTPE